MIDAHPDPAQVLALLGLLVLGPVGYAVVARWRVTLPFILALAGALVWLRLPLHLEPLEFLRTQYHPDAMRDWRLGAAIDLAAFLWAVSLPALAFDRQGPRAAT